MITTLLSRSLPQKCFTTHKNRIANLQSIRSISNGRDDDDKLLRDDIHLPGVHLDEIDEIMSDVALQNLDAHYPNLDLGPRSTTKPATGHRLMVIQPWVTFNNFDGFTNPELQLEESVSLCNTIRNWQVVDKKIVYSTQINRKNLFHPKAFETLRENVISRPDVSALFFGVELLSGIQLASLEKEFQLPCYDRFTTVLNIFRQHARTKEAKIQLALAELPYIRSHLREIHNSSEYSSSAESLKLLVGGSNESAFYKRMDALKRREKKLRYLLDELRRHRQMAKAVRQKSGIPVISVVGYTNSGKTSLIKYLTSDERLIPEDKLFATLDVTPYRGQLPSSRNVIYMDTVGFISRIPLLLVEAFSATLKEVQESDLIVHILDITHPDHKIQHSTVIKALEALKIPKRLLESKITVGNKIDKCHEENLPEDLPKCDLRISITNLKNLDELVSMMDHQLMTNLKHDVMEFRVENGGREYSWLRKNSTLLKVNPDAEDGNYLVCRVVMSPAATGRWKKQFGNSGILLSNGNSLTANINGATDDNEGGGLYDPELESTTS